MEFNFIKEGCISFISLFWQALFERENSLSQGLHSLTQTWAQASCRNAKRAHLGCQKKPTPERCWNKNVERCTKMLLCNCHLGLIPMTVTAGRWEFPFLKRAGTTCAKRCSVEIIPDSAELCSKSQQLGRRRVFTQTVHGVCTRETLVLPWVPVIRHWEWLPLLWFHRVTATDSPTLFT